MGFFSSKEKVKSKSQAQPWAPTQIGLAKGAFRVADWMDEPLEFFPEQTYAGQTTAEAQAIRALKGGAAAYPEMLRRYMAPGMGAYETMAGAPTAALEMGLTDVTTNPAVQAQATAIQRQLNRNLMENLLPTVRGGAATRGTLGGTGMQIGEALGTRGTQEAIGSALADLYGGAYRAGLGAETARYTSGLGAAGQAMSLAPRMAQLGLTEFTQPAALLGQAGGLERAEEQRAIDEAKARQEFEQMEPYRRATMGMEALMPSGRAFGTTEREAESRTTPSGFSRLGGALSMAGGLGSIGSRFLPGMMNLFSGGGGSLPIANPYSQGYGMYNNPWTYGGYGMG